jgi:hypothetical protein
MENQHRKITGYRELSAEEIDLMNRIKAKGAEMLELHRDLYRLLVKQEADLYDQLDKAKTSDSDSAIRSELIRRNDAEPMRWASIGKTDIQTGIMALVRAVAQPAV